VELLFMKKRKSFKASSTTHWKGDTTLEHETASGDVVKLRENKEKKQKEKVVHCARLNIETKVSMYAALETCPICHALRGKGMRDCDFEVRDL
jgi:hypothetical protein